jgi:hypothetical protein
LKITVFSSNQRRHLAYINRLAMVSESVFAVLESSTLFPGQVDDFYRKSPVMQEYFSKVLQSEERVFPGERFLDKGVRVLTGPFGDLNRLSREDLEGALDSDIFLVFGSSFIRGWLIRFLIERQAINIHMGLSPYYRGTACNFWAVHDRSPAFVGATVHRLSEGLDSGPILFHSRPSYDGESTFEFTMKAVDQVQQDIVRTIENSTFLSFAGQAQDRSLELRYSKNNEFSDGVAKEFMRKNLSPTDIESLLARGAQPNLISSAHDDS